MEYLQELGYIGLFIGSFLAATIIPFSSEILLTGLIAAHFDVLACILVATAGNWLGSVSTYWLGYVGRLHIIEKYLKINKGKIEKWETKVNKFGVWLALFAWLPFIGDIMSIALGYFKCNFWKVTILLLIGKFSRFMVWGYFIHSFQ